MFKGAYIQLGRVWGIPIRVHWAAPLTALLLGGFNFVPVFWFSFLALMLVHELGHAVAVKLCRAYVTAIDLNPIGGQCHWLGHVTPYQRSLIACGGVAAQLPIAIAGLVLIAIFGHPSNRHLADLAFVCTRYNLLLAALNAIPFPPLDGYEAWKLVDHWKRKRRERGGNRTGKNGTP